MLLFKKTLQNVMLMSRILCLSLEFNAQAYKQDKEDYADCILQASACMEKFHHLYPNSSIFIIKRDTHVLVARLS